MEYYLKPTQITDFPRFPHRGLLIDTARHFLPNEKIFETLELMAQNKLNILHWHITDDQAFSYQSLKYPKITQLGAYSPRHFYTKDDIKQVTCYIQHC